jgi:hypothetical protein
MRPYDFLSSEQLFAIHDRQMERVSDCLNCAEELMRESGHRVLRSRKLLEGDWSVPRKSR